ncbi:hypothetical protein IRJ34_03295 [Paenarthrobacter sp. GOM3]|uniref:hypothetical protein n=1 Tax=Paenarthrobacter sp. GOM3 TaxID=2782567 RepID=UPI001BAD8978|nr:hypothetical protein [Paenarthrobacter sp. GOM3]WOH19366.1 hypothetical protein IRJ34_03295 [Paenarthrobacter sp. GOM3]
MTTMSSRRSLIQGLVVAILVALTGCGTTPSTTPPTNAAEQTMGPEQARTEYLDIFTQIQGLAPGDWTKITPDKPGMACPLPDGTEGTRFNYDSTQGAISEDQAKAIHKSVKEVFESNGLSVVQTQPSGANRDQTTTGFGDGKFSMQLGTSSFGTTLGGNTRCAQDPEGKFR